MSEFTKREEHKGRDDVNDYKYKNITGMNRDRDSDRYSEQNFDKGVDFNGREWDNSKREWDNNKREWDINKADQNKIKGGKQYKANRK